MWRASSRYVDMGFAASGRLDWLVNSIAGVEQGEVDGKDVGFEGFGALLAPRIFAASKAFDWLQGGLGTKLYLMLQ